MRRELDAAIQAEVEGDETLRDHVRKLIVLTIREAYAILEHGRTQDKITLISRLATPAMRTLGAEDGDASSQARKDRAAFESLLAEVRDAAHTTRPPTADQNEAG